MELALAKAICPDGRFALEPRGEVAAGVTLVLSEGQVSVDGVCPPVAARRGHACARLGPLVRERALTPASTWLSRR
jgi:hypothetical protein